MKTEKMLNTTEAANYLGVKESTLKYWRYSGTVLLPFHKVGRLVKYKPSDLNELIENGRKQTT